MTCAHSVTILKDGLGEAQRWSVSTPTWSRRWPRPG